jgi:membrane-associated phospholipid phosphatase
MRKANTRRTAPQINGIPLSYVELVARLRRHLKLKVSILICLILTVAVPFLMTERWPLFPVTIYPEIWLDRAIPFMPIAAWPYLSLWLYTALAGLMLVRRKEVWRCCWIMAGMGLIADVVFVIHPTSIPARPAVSVQPYAFIVANDGTGNACPSLHVAYTLFAAIMMHDWLSRFRRHVILRTVAWTWAFIVILSTMAIRQHLAIDVAWGAVLGLTGAIAWREDLPGRFSTWRERRSLSWKEGGYNKEEPYAGTQHQQGKEGEGVSESLIIKHL